MSEPRTEDAAAASPPGAWPLYRAMVGVGLLCGALIVLVHAVTKPRIERNQAEALQRAILHVLPEARSSASFRLATDGRFLPLLEGERAAEVVHAGYGDGEELVGLAVEASGMGYQDVIRVIWGYSFRDEAIIGMRVLESRETPGLGDRIEKDPAFLQNFERLDVTLTGDGSGLANAIVAVKSGEKANSWEVDGITGATISSVAIADILDRSASSWLPRIRRNLDDLREAKGTP